MDSVCHLHCFHPRGDLTVAKVTGWYRQRAIQVESLSGLVENSLKLVSLALDRNVNVSVIISFASV